MKLFINRFARILAAALCLALVVLCPQPAKAMTQAWDTVGDLSLSGVNPYSLRVALNSQGTPYAAYRTNMGVGTLLKFTGNAWETVGGGPFVQASSLPDSLDLAIDSQGTPYVAFNGPQPTVMRYTASGWETLSSFSLGGSGRYIRMALDSQGMPYIAYRDNSTNALCVKKYNGATWEPLGPQNFPGLLMDYICIALDKDDTPYVAYEMHSGPTAVVVVKYNGTTWDQVGGYVGTVNTVWDVGLAIDGNGVPYVAQYDGGYGAVLYRFDGISWPLIGAFGNGSDTGLAIDSKNTPYLAFRKSSDGNNGYFKRYNVASGAWEDVGGPFYMGSGFQMTSVTFDSQDQPYIIYKDWGDSHPHLYTYNTYYSLNFEAGEHGTLSGTASQTVLKGGSGAAVTAVPDEHCHFTQWSDGLKTTTRTETDVQSDLSLTAQFAVDTHTVTFDSESGSEIPEKTVEYNTAISKPIPTRTGYTFGDWYPTDTFDTEPVSFPYTVTGDATFHAKWTANSYTIQYDKNGGDGGQTTASSHKYDTEKTLTACGFTKCGYTFAGWALNPDDPVQYDDREGVKNLTAESDGNVTLYAKWTPNHYTVSYEANGGSGSMADTACTYGDEKALRDNTFTRTGYTFAGWAEASDGPVKYADKAKVLNLTAGKDAEITLYAKWTKTAYTITYRLNGGAVSPANPGGYNVESTTFTLINPKRTGFTFKGWTGTDIAAPTISVAIRKGSTGNRSYTANWTVNTYIISTSVNSSKYGKVTGGGTVKAGDTVRLTAIPFDGYRFIKWMEGSKEIKPSPYAYSFTAVKARSLKAYFEKIGTPKLSSAKDLGKGVIKVSWKAVSGANGYYISYATSKSGKYTLKKSAGSALYFNVSGLKKGKTYYFKVQAYCTGAKTTTGGYSNILSVKVK